MHQQDGHDVLEILLGDAENLQLCQEQVDWRHGHRAPFEAILEVDGVRHSQNIQKDVHLDAALRRVIDESLDAPLLALRDRWIDPVTKLFEHQHDQALLLQVAHQVDVDRRLAIKPQEDVSSTGAPLADGNRAKQAKRDAAGGAALDQLPCEPL